MERRTVTIIGQLVLLIAVVGGCGGCSDRKEVLSGLDAQQSIEAVVTLSRAGVDVQREKLSAGRSERYRILVASPDEAQALALLHEFRLPRESGEVIDEFTKQQGFTPNTPQMESLRLDYALGLRIERLLSSLPGVVEVKALVRANLQTSSFDSGPQEAPGASIVIRFVSPTNEPSFSLKDVQQMVLQAIPGLSAERLQIRTAPVLVSGGNAIFASGPNQSGAIAKLAQLRPFVFRVPEDEVERASTQIVFILIAVCIAGIIVGWVWGANTVRNRLKRRTRSGEAQKNFFLEASFSGEETKGKGKLLPGRGGPTRSFVPPKKR
ncbi:MAG: hypothetical protein KDD69_04880 [Bdellovibrionales bacterium]|nr:hypothetical protein [Bdellovibrionales bacterium]